MELPPSRARGSEWGWGPVFKREGAAPGGSSEPCREKPKSTCLLQAENHAGCLVRGPHSLAMSHPQSRWNGNPLPDLGRGSTRLPPPARHSISRPGADRPIGRPALIGRGPGNRGRFLFWPCTKEGVRNMQRRRRVAAGTGGLRSGVSGFAPRWGYITRVPFAVRGVRRAAGLSRRVNVYVPPARVLPRCGVAREAICPRPRWYTRGFLNIEPKSATRHRGTCLARLRAPSHWAAHCMECGCGLHTLHGIARVAAIADRRRLSGNGPDWTGAVCAVAPCGTRDGVNIGAVGVDPARG